MNKEMAKLNYDNTNSKADISASCCICFRAGCQFTDHSIIPYLF